MIHVFVTTRLDYCNSLFLGVSRSLARLQMVQNAAARLLTGTWKQEYSCYIWSSLHWLPIHVLIHLKCVLFTFVCFKSYLFYCLMSGGSNWTLWDIWWSRNLLVASPDFSLSRLELSLPSCCSYRRNTEEPETGAPDTGDFRLQSPETSTCTQVISTSPKL